MANMWGIHNDRSGIDPVTQGMVRIGWDELGDLGAIPATRDAFKRAIEDKLPSVTQSGVPGNAGVLYRFVHELSDGDIVVCLNRQQRTLNIGRVSGAYRYLEHEESYRNARPVEWLKTGIPRVQLSLEAQRELGVATTLFQILKAGPEIEDLLESPSSVFEPDFGWTQFYAELADRLLQYSDRRTDLLSKIWRVEEASGRAKLFRTLKHDRLTTGERGPLRDIDPFTTFSVFNRGIREEARADIARAFGVEFNVSAAPPTEFPGVPIVNNLGSWFIKWEEKREPEDVDRLWTLARAAVAYADNENEATRGALVAAFDACVSGNTRKLTMALFWIRPTVFAAYDAWTTSYLQRRHPALAQSLSLKARITGEQFLDNTEKIRRWIDEDAESPKGIPELSRLAYIDGTTQDGIGGDDSVTAELQHSPDPDLDMADTYDAESIRLDGAFLQPEEIESIMERLQIRKNIILQGPPGTGKTWLARRLAWALCGEKQSERASVVQFHPSLSYEDFVRGWRPSGSGLTLADGPFLDVCGTAAVDPQNAYVIVIEEINRGSPAQVFGELLTLIEPDKRSQLYAQRLAYPRSPDERFHVPPNVYIIGTMNVADRSLAMVDLALRRRFAFIELEPMFTDDWIQHVSGLGYDLELLESFAGRLQQLNKTITDDSALGRQFRIGHSFFTPTVSLEGSGHTTEQWWHEVIRTEIRPLLEEYWFDRLAQADEACEKLLLD